MCVSAQNFTQIIQTVAEIPQFFFFFPNSCHPPFWICGANFGTTHNE